ncbi:hypothetical protein SAMN04489726_7791 [Allokutzneria albata]|uniref:Uncharacterized protein n=1 Tax=Allokutzneria albata TaxID=211114 RepID=A0A1H0DGP5_ALLAB|nr:hypothetical protein SAMN04489726_7791 [Allokutzneria albata]
MLGVEAGPAKEFRIETRTLRERRATTNVIAGSASDLHPENRNVVMVGAHLLDQLTDGAAYAVQHFAHSVQEVRGSPGQAGRGNTRIPCRWTERGGVPFRQLVPAWLSKETPVARLPFRGRATGRSPQPTLTQLVHMNWPFSVAQPRYHSP